MNKAGVANIKNAKNRIHDAQVVNEMKERCKKQDEDFTFDISQT